VTITAYLQTEPSVDLPTSLSVHVQNMPQRSDCHVTWTTAGNHGTLHAGTQTGTTITDQWNVVHTPTAATLDLQTGGVQVELPRGAHDDHAAMDPRRGEPARGPRGRAGDVAMRR